MDIYAYGYLMDIYNIKSDEILYRKKQFIIIRCRKDNKYIIWNRKKDFCVGHAHIANYNYGKKVINNILNMKVFDELSEHDIKTYRRLNDKKSYDYVLSITKIKKDKGEENG